MLTLGGHDRFTLVAAFNPDNGDLVPLARRPDEPYGVDGFFVCRARRLLGLYRLNGCWRFRAGRVDFDVETARVERRVVGPLHTLRFVGDDGKATTCRYLDWELAWRWFIPESWDDTPFVESEDFNWGLFVKHVMDDPGRRSRLGRTTTRPTG